MEPLFSIVVVCLNAGEKLKTTIDSIISQDFSGYEIVIKDGGSWDGSLTYVEQVKEKLGEKDLPGKVPGIELLIRKDQGIYDAMNQGVAETKGKLVYFLNCGDVFRERNVLSRMAEFVNKHSAERGIYYGNIYERLTGQVVSSNPHLDAFGCYRNVPCHQACFYDRQLLKAHPFRTEYRVRADYEQFLWCFFKGGTEFYYIDAVIADYEGGGFSETAQNRKRSAREHKEIVRQYMSFEQILKYRLILLFTLAPLRSRLARSRVTAGLYNRFKSMIYGKG